MFSSGHNGHLLNMANLCIDRKGIFTSVSVVLLTHIMTLTILENKLRRGIMVPSQTWDPLNPRRTSGLAFRSDGMTAAGNITATHHLDGGCILKMSYSLITGEDNETFLLLNNCIFRTNPPLN